MQATICWCSFGRTSAMTFVPGLCVNLSGKHVDASCPLIMFLVRPGQLDASVRTVVSCPADYKKRTEQQQKLAVYKYQCTIQLALQTLTEMFEMFVRTTMWGKWLLREEKMQKCG